MKEKVVVYAGGFTDEPIVPIQGDRSGELIRKLEERFDIEYRCDNPEKRDGLKVEMFDGVVAVVADFLETYDRELLEQIGVKNGGSVRLLSRYGVGVNNIDLAAANESGIMVTNCPGCNSLPTAEWTVSRILDVAGNDVHQRNLASQGRDKDGTSRQDIFGKTVGIVGTGNIGRRVGRILELGFGANLIAYSPSQHGEWVEAHRVDYKNSVDDICREADIVTLHATPPDGSRLIGQEQLELMKPTAILVNCARGYLVDEEAVYHAVRKEKLFGYGVDEAWTREDLPLDGLNIVTSPHVGSDSDLGKNGMKVMSLQAVVDLMVDEKRPEYVVRDGESTYEK